MSCFLVLKSGKLVKHQPSPVVLTVGEVAHLPPDPLLAVHLLELVG